jgi:hypothetical protein
MADNTNTIERNGADMTTITNSLALAGIAGAITFAALTAATPMASAGSYSSDAGRTAVWVYVRAFRGEDVWETCRRVYRRDVYQVRRGGGPGEARCYIDASSIGDPRGYNRSRYRD